MLDSLVRVSRRGGEGHFDSALTRQVADPSARVQARKEYRREINPSTTSPLTPAPGRRCPGNQNATVPYDRHLGIWPHDH